METSAQTHKTYQAPAVVVELTLETRAGTPLNIFDPLSEIE